MCESNNLYQFLDLGFLPPAGEVLGEEELNSHEIFFPLKVAQCQDCGLTQLIYVVNPEILYGERYGYESSITETGKKHFFEMANSICEKFKLDSKDLVVDIGANVGLFSYYCLEKGVKNIYCLEPDPKAYESLIS